MFFEKKTTKTCMVVIAGAIFMQRIFKSVASFSMDIVKKKEWKLVL